MSVRQSAEEIAQEAARWAWRLEAGDFDGPVQAELESWLEGDTRRRGALLQAEAAWLAADLAERGTLDADVDADSEPDAETPARGGMSRRSLLAGFGGLAAASVAAIYLSGTPTQDYETAIGEVRRIPLEDRSTMAINTGSRLTVAYSETRRSVSIEKGEAWFQVMKDKARPFVVSAGAVQVEAVGTAFSVRRRDGGAEVMVTEGTVRVWVEGRKADAISLSAGSSAFVTGAAQVQPAAPAAPTIERKLAWRAGKMSLDGETLGEAAAEFNRYSPTQIQIRDPDVAQKRLYGVFRLDDPEGFARTAAITLGVAAWSEDKHIVIAKTRR